MRKAERTVVLLWLAWAVILLAYQAYATMRFRVYRPDYAVSWTSYETRAHSQDDKPYLIEPFLNTQVSWDSEYYISIAIGGYDDPEMRAIPPDFSWDRPQTKLKKVKPEWISMNYAFFPFYPLLMRLVAFPLRLTGLSPIAAATLAGVLVSLAGTLGAMIALLDLGRALFGEHDGLRAAYYLLIWPAGMFLAQVYTEGLFLGLSFGALAMARRKRWGWAALLAACATWTRASGGLLLLPIAGYWLASGGLKAVIRRPSAKSVGTLLLVLAPLWAYLIWRVALGTPFHIVESRYFSRGLLLIRRSLEAWGNAIAYAREQPQAMAYYAVEFAATAFALLACALLAKRAPWLAAYSLAVIIFSFTSGVAQGMHRYVMAAPVVFLLPARWGRNAVFDRAWTLANVLLMGIFAAMFSFDFWAG